MRETHPKRASAIEALADAVEDTKRLLTHRDGLRAVLGAIGYLGFDVFVLWSAFLAIGTHPTPTFAVVLMAYIIGALGGSIPLPAGVGSIGGMVLHADRVRRGPQCGGGSGHPLPGDRTARAANRWRDRLLLLRGKIGPIQQAPSPEPSR